MDLVSYLYSNKYPLDIWGEWMFLQNPKTASTSMERGPLKERVVRYNTTRRKWMNLWHKLYKNNLDGVFKFCVVRNPWDRVVSAFFYLHHTGKVSEDISFKEYVKEVLVKNSIWIDFYSKNDAAHYSSVKPYIRSVLYWNDVSIDFHFESQCPRFLFDGSVFVDYIIRFEHLQDGWNYVSKIIGVSPKLPHYKKAIPRPHYTTYYDDKSAEIVGDLYRVEIEALDYKFGEN